MKKTNLETVEAIESVIYAYLSDVENFRHELDTERKEAYQTIAKTREIMEKTTNADEYTKASDEMNDARLRLKFCERRAKAPELDSFKAEELESMENTIIEAKNKLVSDTYSSMLPIYKDLIEQYNDFEAELSRLTQIVKQVRTLKHDIAIGFYSEDEIRKIDTDIGRYKFSYFIKWLRSKYEQTTRCIF